MVSDADAPVLTICVRREAVNNNIVLRCSVPAALIPSQIHQHHACHILILGTIMY